MYYENRRIVTLTSNKRIPHDLKLSGLPVDRIIDDVNTSLLPIADNKTNIWVTLFTGPQPPKQIPETIFQTNIAKCITIDI